MYKSHAKLRGDGTIVPLRSNSNDAAVDGHFTTPMDLIDNYMYTVDVAMGTNATSGDPMSAGTFLVSTGDSEIFVYTQQCADSGDCIAPVFNPSDSTTFNGSSVTVGNSTSTGIRFYSR